MPEHTHGGQGTALRRFLAIYLVDAVSLHSSAATLYTLGYLTRKLPPQHRRAKIAV